jgi:hypothetical protein
MAESRPSNTSGKIYIVQGSVNAVECPATALAALFLAIAFAYIIFGNAGFGTALLSSPVPAMFIP